MSYMFIPLVKKLSRNEPLTNKRTVIKIGHLKIFMKCHVTDDNV